MLRTVLILAALVPAVGAQTPPAERAPIDITGKVSAIDPQLWPGFSTGPGLFMTIQNVSARGIQGCVYETFFTSPKSGRHLERREHSAYRPPSLGGLLPPGANMAVDKPYQIPMAAPGIAANYSFNVDLVVFEDGTTWGPAKTGAAKQLLSRIQRAQLAYERELASVASEYLPIGS